MRYTSLFFCYPGFGTLLYPLSLFMCCVHFLFFLFAIHAMARSHALPPVNALCILSFSHPVPAPLFFVPALCIHFFFFAPSHGFLPFFYLTCYTYLFSFTTHTLTRSHTLFSLHALCLHSFFFVLDTHALGMFSLSCAVDAIFIAIIPQLPHVPMPLFFVHESQNFILFLSLSTHALDRFQGPFLCFGAVSHSVELFIFFL